MIWLKRFLLKLGILKAGNEAFREDLDEEIQSHLDQMIEENIAAGMSSKEARSAALKRFGNVLGVKEDCRASWGVRVWDQSIQALQFAARHFFKNLFTSILSVAVLAMGLGISIAMFAASKAILWDGIGSPNDGRLFMIYWQTASHGIKDVTPEDFRFLKDNLESFESITAFDSDRGSFRNKSTDQYAESYNLQWVSEDFFETLGIKPMHGSGFSSNDSKEELHSSIIISHRLWQKHFNSEVSAIGETAFVGTKPYRIKGVMPSRFSFPIRSDIWIFKDWAARQVDGTPASLKSSVEVCGLLRKGVEIESAKTELETLAAMLVEKNDSHYFDLFKQRMRTIVPAGLESINGEFNAAIFATLVCSILVLAASSANASNLIAARAFKRSYELATRRALGASRLNIVGHVALDAALLAIAGAFLGWIAAAWGCKLMQSLVDSIDKASRHWHFKLDTEVVLFALAATLLATILSSIIPALRATRPDVNTILKDDERTSSSAIMGKLARSMIGFQITISGAMLITAIIISSEIMRVANLPLGVDSKKILLVDIDIRGRGGNESQEATLQFYGEIKRQLEALSYIESAAYTQSNGGLKYRPRMSIRREDVSYGSEEEWPIVLSQWLSRDAFRTYDVEFLAGRDFNQFDRIDTEPVCIVSKTLAKKRWPDEDPIGKRIVQREDGRLYRIIGVVPDILDMKSRRYPEISSQVVYFYYGQKQKLGKRKGFIARSSHGIDQYITPIRTKLAETMPYDAPQIQSFESSLDEELAEVQIFATLFSVFGILLLFKAFTGLYAIMAFAAKDRLKEFGIRIALGAVRTDIIKSAFRNTIFQIIMGIGLGLGIGYVISAIIVGAIFEGTPNTSPFTRPEAYLIAIITILTVSVLATGIPAWKTVSTDPLRALREE